MFERYPEWTSVRRPCGPTGIVLYLCVTSLLSWGSWWFTNSSCFVSKPWSSRQVSVCANWVRSSFQPVLVSADRHKIWKCFINNILCRTFYNDNSNICACLLQCWGFHASLFLLTVEWHRDLERLISSLGSIRLFWIMYLLLLLVRQKSCLVNQLPYC